MNDMSLVIIPKSDQINADDLLAGPRTITIAGVSIKPGTEQPVSMTIVDDKKVFRPCKSMCRVMVQAWGRDANLYTGRSLTLYCDPSVKFGPLEVGGIRISHMSHIDRQIVMALTATKGNKKPFVVKPLKVEEQTKAATPDPVRDWIAKFVGMLGVVPSVGDLQSLLNSSGTVNNLNNIRAKRPELMPDVDGAIDDARERLRPPVTADEPPPSADPDDEIPF